MILDSEQQRQNLMQIVRQTPLNGNMEQVTSIIQMFQELVNALANATIEQSESSK